MDTSIEPKQSPDGIEVVEVEPPDRQAIRNEDVVRCFKRTCGKCHKGLRWVGGLSGNEPRICVCAHLGFMKKHAADLVSFQGALFWRNPRPQLVPGPPAAA